MTSRLIFPILPLSISLGVLSACGGGAAIPATAPARESGQSALMDQSFAGKNKCSAKGHERPFVIEWDATDMSSFEARTATDIIFVKYEGCELKVLDSCVNDSIKGSLGSYKAPEWTSGSVETIDISNEGELYAKLPLGAATLAGRVSGGEKFHMEYFVSGTRAATRDTVYAKDLEKISGCKQATHFVYAYNLGAFALGSQSNIKGTVGGSAFGFGAGGSKASENKAEKHGGLLSSCRGESAKEVQTCKVPVRLTLREIDKGENPDAANAVAPETKGAMNLAGKVDAKLKMNEAARGHYDAAMDRYRARDGKACIKELEASDKGNSDVAQLSITAGSYSALVRAECVMLSGQCDAGKNQLRKTWTTMNPDQSPEQADAVISSFAGMYCQGDSMSPRDQVIQASQKMMQGSMTKKDLAYCTQNWETIKKLSATVKPKDEDDNVAKSALNIPMNGNWAAMCFGRAGDCTAAYKAFEDARLVQMKGDVSLTERTKANSRATFDNYVPSCKGK